MERRGPTPNAIRPLESILQSNGVFGITDYERRVDEGDTKLDEQLFLYWMDTGEMPYGTMKARTGDPDQWVYDHTVMYLQGRIM